MTNNPEPIVDPQPREGARRTTRPPKRGVFSPDRVRFVSFAVITLALFGAAVLCVLAIWDYTTRGNAWRAMATLGVIVGTMLAFTVLNEVFGARMSNVKA